MYGHLLCELDDMGIVVPDDLVARAEAGLRHLMARRRRAGLVTVFHPWETGCDDSPRWDSWGPHPWDVDAWRERKIEVAGSLVIDRDLGSPSASPLFEVGSAAFTALVVFNALELAQLVDRRQVGAGLDLREEAVRLGRALRERWDPRIATVVDGGAHPSASVRTLEALLLVLVLDDGADEVELIFGQLRDDRAFGGACGPTQVHRAEPAFDPGRYWRGPAWPQLTYLFWVAATRRKRWSDARWLRDAMVKGASSSGLAEYWNADSGEGYGATPQSWTGLAALVEDRTP